MEFISNAFARYAPGIAYGAAVAIGFKGVEAGVEKLQEIYQKRKASKSTVNAQAKAA